MPAEGRRMAYNQFTFADVVARFGLTVDTRHDLFAEVRPVPPAPHARAAIDLYGPIALTINTEKARSELLIAPVLAEVWRQAEFRVSYYSGTAFHVDPDDGLTGTADYLFTRGPQLPDAGPPVLVVVEGKNESINSGYAQLAAELVAARRLNARAGTPDDPVYGCVTTGSEWKFFRLRGAALDIDRPQYPIARLDKLLGILLHAVGSHPDRPAEKSVNS
jgi:hypothetical protein